MISCWFARMAGADGAVDDPIDTAFTSVLLDSVAIWYSVDPKQRYIMGFSWGGRTTYTYGLNHADDFCGFMPIGAAINGSSTFSAVAANANGKPFYLVHGANDAPGTRYHPALSLLNNNNAIVNSLLMPGVGHTIDFPNRNQILGTAFEWLEDENSCAVASSTTNISLNLDIQVLSNPVPSGGTLRLRIVAPGATSLHYQLVQTDGRIVQQQQQEQVSTGENIVEVPIPSGVKGLLQLSVWSRFGTHTISVVAQ